MSRTWEVHTNTVMPIDLVREQDFILRLRRLQKLGTAHLVVNLVLSAIPAVAKARHVLEAVQASLKDFAKVTNATYAEMSNGDVFLIWEETDDAELLAKRLVSVLPVEGHQVEDVSSYLLAYHLPQNYTALRERANHYVEVVRAASTMATDTAAAGISADAEGPLTAWGVDQVGKLLDDIDIRTYARTQSIYRLNDNDTWQPVSEEYFISFDDLRRERFPKLDLITPEHLFFALCEMVDTRLLALLSKNHAAIADRSVQVNLAVASVINKVFAQFAHAIPRDKRGLITFELHRGDIFQDFARTLGALETLHAEGFKVAIDSVTPDMLPYINLNAFGFDSIKINVSGDRAALLKLEPIQKALRALPVDKVIFFRCDSAHALQAGRDLGIRLFQGWRISDAAGHGDASHKA